MLQVKEGVYHIPAGGTSDITYTCTAEYDTYNRQLSFDSVAFSTGYTIVEVGDNKYTLQQALHNKLISITDTVVLDTKTKHQIKHGYYAWAKISKRTIENHTSLPICIRLTDPVIVTVRGNHQSMLEFTKQYLWVRYYDMGDVINTRKDSIFQLIGHWEGVPGTFEDLYDVLKDDSILAAQNSGGYMKCVFLGYRESGNEISFIIDTGDCHIITLHSIASVQACLANLWPEPVLLIKRPSFYKAMKYLLTDSTFFLNSDYTHYIDLSDPSVTLHYEGNWFFSLTSYLQKNCLLQDFTYGKERKKTEIGKHEYGKRWFYAINDTFTNGGKRYTLTIENEAKSRGYNEEIDEYMQYIFGRLNALSGQSLCILYAVYTICHDADKKYPKMAAQCKWRNNLFINKIR